MVPFDLQPTIANELITITPLKDSDFEKLYAVAADPLIWEQHPNKDRYQRKVFERFFEGAMASKGAFLITETETGNAVGSTRFYDLDTVNSNVAVGYTFLSRTYWGKGYNKALKTAMFNYALQYVNRIILHIGATNFRSQKAIEKLGGNKFEELEVAYYGEPTKLNFAYEITKQTWSA